MNVFEERRESTPDVLANESLRIVFIGVLALLVTLVFVFRLVQFQVWDRDEYITGSEQNSIRHVPLAPPRGKIIDRNGVVLARNKFVQSLFVLTGQVQDLDEALRQLSQFVELTESEIQKFRKHAARAAGSLDGALLKGRLLEDEVHLLALNRFQLPAFRIAGKTVRYYPFGETFAHAIGTVRRITHEDLRELPEQEYRGTDYVGRQGVERVYERALHGTPGFRRVEVDAVGRVATEIFAKPPVPGEDCTLFLDAGLQRAADEALGDRRGAVVALEVATGGVLAMVSKPSYDPNAFLRPLTKEQFESLGDPLSTPFFNRATKGRYAPGSTIKPVIGLAALSQSAVDWDEVIYDGGEYRLPNVNRAFCRDWNWKKGNAGGQGQVDMYRGIYRSSNVYFCAIGERTGIDAIASLASQFGLGTSETHDIVDADPGNFPSSDTVFGSQGRSWGQADTLNVSIGQGDVLATPLQMADVAATLARRGERLRPRMVKSPHQDLPLLTPEPVPPVSGPDASDWNMMASAMEAVVQRGNLGYGQDGTAWAHIGIGIKYRLAGKSGTAQVMTFKQGEEYKEEETPEHLRNHAWFIGFAPAEDPKIAVAVVVENGGGGSAVAGPIAREVIDFHLLPSGPLVSSR